MKKVIAVIIICVLLCGVAVAKAPSKEEIEIGKKAEILLTEKGWEDAKYYEERGIIVLRFTLDAVKSNTWGKQTFEKANQVLVEAINKSGEAVYNYLEEALGDFLPDIIMAYYSGDGELIMAYCNGVEIGDLIELY